MYGQDSYVLAVRQVYPFERCADVQGVDRLIGNVGDLDGNDKLRRVLPGLRCPASAHPHEPNALQSGQVLRQLKHGHVRQLLTI